MRPEGQFPAELSFLFDPYPGKILYGGRGGMKSYAAADALLTLGTQQFERVLCARETMHSLAESVHYLLEQRITALGLKDKYRIQQGTIIGPQWSESERTEFIFAGLHHNVANIKSLEGVTKVWVEEGQGVSQHSWDTLRPTIRWSLKGQEAQVLIEQGVPFIEAFKRVGGRFAEIWITYNPELDTDATHKLMLNAPPGWAVCKTTYLNNPWLPPNLRAQAEEMQRTDLAKYKHIWLGETISAVEGAIYAGEIAAAEEEGRVGPVPYDRSLPVHTFWDLGFGDTNCIIFAQAQQGWFNCIDYMTGNQKTIAYWVTEMQRKPYIYGTDWLPHDGVDAMTHHRLAGATGDKSKSPEMLLRAVGRKVRVAPKMEKASSINAARTIFSQCRFDEKKCADLLMGLRHYQMGPDAKSGMERRIPLHNWASHHAEAFHTLALGIKQPTAPVVHTPEPEIEYSPYG